MKIAILGTRGVPANYGGFETFAEECAAGLSARGHRVTVYGRSHYVDPSLRRHRGIDIVVLPSLRFKYLDTMVHTLMSLAHALFQGFDVLLFCNAANSVYTWLPRLLGTPVVVNVDGIERLRLKWSWLGRTWYHLSEYFSVWFPNAIVTDARVIERYYRETYGARSTFIPYGAITEKPAASDILPRLGLTSGEYFLYVSRLEPENNAHLVVAAFERLRSTKRLVVVGDAPYAKGYIESVKATADARVLFPGAIYGTGYRQLMGNAFCYIHATEVGGSHPALIEAMGQGNIIIANGTPENTEVLGNAGILYRKNDATDLTRCMQSVNDAPALYQKYRTAALERVCSEYCWDSVVGKYEELFSGLTQKRRRAGKG
jgi:glycosyltransferase involved in cell wall biosynthesis